MTIDLAQSTRGDSYRHTLRLACSLLPLALSRLVIENTKVLEVVSSIAKSRLSISEQVHKCVVDVLYICIHFH